MYPAKLVAMALMVDMVRAMMLFVSSYFDPDDTEPHGEHKLVANNS